MSEKCFCRFNGYQVKDSVARTAAEENAAAVLAVANDLQKNENNLQSHQNNKQNPHGVTAEQIGARPNTWIPTPEEIGIVSDVESAEYPGCFYRTVDGETEWINPPMIDGVSYRTSKRSNGLIVYTKRLDLGTLPSKSQKTVAHGISGDIIYSVAFAKTDNRVQLLPCISSSYAATVRYHLNPTNFVIDTNSDLTDYTGWAILEYTEVE